LFGLWNNAASWSLSAEAFFYALFPFVLPIFAGAQRRALWITIAVLYGLSVLPGLVFLSFEPRPTPGLRIFYSMPIFRFPEFLVGVCAYHIMHKCSTVSRWLPHFAGATVAALVVYLCLVGDRLPIYVTHNWIVVPAVTLTIVALASSNANWTKVFSNPVSVWAGKISYCFYSFQVVVVLLFQYFRNYLPSDGALTAFLALGLLTVISSLGFTYVEEPFRKRLRRIR
jgi:peptidoglycan/LPS O-acetylase OafA/YrhL